MSTVKNIAQSAKERDRTAVATEGPRVSLASKRWSPVRRAPKLVTFSWGAVAPSMTRR